MTTPITKAMCEEWSVRADDAGRLARACMEAMALLGTLCNGGCACMLNDGDTYICTKHLSAWELLRAYHGGKRRAGEVSTSRERAVNMVKDFGVWQEMDYQEFKYLAQSYLDALDERDAATSELAAARKELARYNIEYADAIRAARRDNLRESVSHGSQTTADRQWAEQLLKHMDDLTLDYRRLARMYLALLDERATENKS